MASPWVPVTAVALVADPGAPMLTWPMYSSGVVASRLRVTSTPAGALAVATWAVTVDALPAARAGSFTAIVTGRPPLRYTEPSRCRTPVVALDRPPRITRP